MPAKLYQWSEWFAKRRVVLRRGVDYHTTQSSFIQQIRQAATRAGLAAQGFIVSISDRNDEVVVEITKGRKQSA